MNRITVPTSYDTRTDFDVSIDGYFIGQNPLNSRKFISAKASSKTKGFYIRKSSGFYYWNFVDST